MEPWLFVGLIVGFVVLLGCNVIVSLVLRTQIQRYERFRAEVITMIASHQDLLASHESRLAGLGSRGNPVPTSAEMEEGRWHR